MRRCSFAVACFFLFHTCVFISLLKSSLSPHHHLLPPPSLTLPSQVFINQDPRIGCGITIKIYHCTTIRYSALRLKDMLETYFPGISVILDIKPPMSKNRWIIRAIRVGSFTFVVAGENIVQMIGVRVRLRPRQFYFLLFRIWNLTRTVIMLLEQTGAFEVHINGELIFSKLNEHRFPTELELRELVSGRVVASIVEDGLGAGILWSSRIQGLNSQHNLQLNMCGSSSSVVSVTHVTQAQ